jgi:hypothetical protein
MKLDRLNFPIINQAGFTGQDLSIVKSKGVDYQRRKPFLLHLGHKCGQMVLGLCRGHKDLPHYFLIRVPGFSVQGFRVSAVAASTRRFDLALRSLFST